MVYEQVITEGIRDAMPPGPASELSHLRGEGAGYLHATGTHGV